MREEGKILKSSSWPKVVVRKWLNMKSGDDEFHSDYRTNAQIQRRRKSCSDDGLYVVVPEELSDEWLTETSNETERQGLNHQLAPQATSSLNLRMFVGTWNVGGKSPHDGLNLSDWLRTKASADIYVFGFQEIVPLNAGNVLGPEDCGPAAKWLSLIRQALNRDADNHASKQSPIPNHQHPFTKSRVSFSDLLALEDDLIEQKGFQKFSSLGTNSCYSVEGSPSPPNESAEHYSPVQHRYYLVASKQMVGIFVCVWVREDLYEHITSWKVSCVGRGIMGYLGNKGSISISMTLHQTTFCFVCTHLTSGEKEGDAIRRNFDVMEILKRTRFSNPYRIPKKSITPNTILDHDKIIWLGDLNYRLAPSYGDIHELLERNDWQALLEKDELRIEQKTGRVFKGWEEGEIYFAPTYKYITNSDRYVVQTSVPKEKRRTPAWCDRILWKGEGLKQMCYVRGESRFSDHRPVSSLFSVEVNLPNDPNPTSKMTSNATHSSTPTDLLSESTVLSSANEFLLVARTQSCIQTAPRFSVTSKK